MENNTSEKAALMVQKHFERFNKYLKYADVTREERLNTVIRLTELAVQVELQSLLLYPVKDAFETYDEQFEANIK